NDGNSIKIFNASINKKTSTILDVHSLKKIDFVPLKKRLLFDFSRIKNQLTQGIIDNIEGITFGPKLSNGNQSLLLVSDDNFQIYGPQLNQFLLMEIITK
ncbi:MAG: esterase-like activity of phytase family protein, partial [Polaribacter sp.]